jgi:hypothetical protein
LVVYSPLKDVIVAEGQLARLRGEQAEVAGELASLRASLVAEQNRIRQEALEAENERNRKELERLRADSAAVATDRDRAVQQSRDLQQKLSAFEKRNRELAARSAGDSEARREFEAAADAAGQEADGLRAQVVELESLQKLARTRVQSIDRSLSTRAIAGTEVVIWADDQQSSRYFENKLRDEGASVKLIDFSSGFLRTVVGPVDPETTRISYHSPSREAAFQISALLEADEINVAEPTARASIKGASGVVVTVGKDSRRPWR